MEVLLHDKENTAESGGSGCECSNSEYVCGFILISSGVLTYCMMRALKAQLAYLQAELVYLMLHLSMCISDRGREKFRQDREQLLH